MTTERTHYFRDDNDDRTVVRTVQIGPGSYRAYVIEGLHSDLEAVGYGQSRIGAIASLHEAIEAERDQ